jgi:hypothetical protein
MNYNINIIVFFSKVIKSVFKIPKATDQFTKENSSFENFQKLYLIDAFRTPIAQLFEVNDFIRNFRTENHTSNNTQSLISDLCVHAGELASFRNERYTPFNKHFLPEFNCLYLSPTNFWSNDFTLFNQDDDIMQTINGPSDFNNKNSKETRHDEEETKQNSDASTSKYFFCYVSLVL